MEGYIKAYRQLMNWEWYTDVNVKTLFIHCLLRANIKEQHFQGKTINAGQFVSSLDHLAAETGLTKRQVRTAIEKLKKTFEIDTQTTSRYSIITVINWNKYQECDTQMTHERHTDDTQMTLIEEGKERKKEKNIYSPISFSKDFLEWFAIYPRKESKRKAFESYERALKDGATVEQLLDGVKGYNNYISHEKKERQFIKMPTTWLNQGCWEDNYEIKTYSILDGIIK